MITAFYEKLPDPLTEHGYDKLDIMVHFMSLLDGAKIKSNYDKFKSYLVCLIQRGVTTQEEINMAEGIIKYVKSEPGTNERLEAMDYLFGLKFITNEPTTNELTKILS